MVCCLALKVLQSTLNLLLDASDCFSNIMHGRVPAWCFKPGCGRQFQGVHRVD